MKRSNIIQIFTLFTALLSIMSVDVLCNEITGKVIVNKKGGKKSLRTFEHTLVYIEGIETKAPEKPAILKQINKEFIPRLLPIVKGQTVHFLNGDRVRHNVFSPDENEQFDLGRFPKGQFKPWTFKGLGQHKVYCNIHQQMIGDVFVVTNSYFSLTDKNGNYTIKGIPNGKYTIKTWHIYGGTSTKEITVDGTKLNLDFTITSTKVIREIEDHENKDGDDYDEDEDY